jgi:hypothetical protein
MTMNYEAFRTLWHEALNAAGLPPHPLWTTETIDVNEMSREYTLYVPMGGRRGAEPFNTTAKLEWHWDAALAARTATSEEDLLMELMGRDAYYLVTEQPWMRIDVELRATLPWGSPLPMPEADTWRRWAAEVSSRIDPILPIDSMDHEDGLWVLSGRSEPEAQLQCCPGGELRLTGVSLSAWQGIWLPREWDNSDREPDDWPEDDLADFFQRVDQALDEWENCLKHLI